VLTTVAGRGNLELGYRFLAASLAPVDATTDRLWAVFGLTLLVVGAAGAAIAWWVVRSGLRPVDRMIDTAGAIAGGDLTARVDHPDDATELGRLGTALDAMLGRLEVAFAEQEASEQRVKRFAADASHELRTPITTIRGYAELYQRGGLADDEALARAMARIEGESTRMGRLVEELLLLARLDQRRPLERGPVDLRRIVADAAADHLAVSPEHPLVVRDAPAGDGDGTVVVAGDEAALRQVVANLLANVRVHTPPGTTTTVELRSESQLDPPVALLVVSDDGPGLPPDQIDRAFERFHRGDPSRSRDTGGAGLGLAIVEAIVAAHGGSVEVADAAPGARFTVRLPLA
jgi:two-component system OmpR family sensor kinase